MESLTYIKNLRISPKKMRFLLGAIKKLKPQEALDYLYYTPKKPARIFYKVIKSAITNAKNVLKIEESQLHFKLLTVEEGQKLKRFRSGGRGTVKSIKKRFSHVKVILVADQNIEKKELKVKPKEKVKVTKSKIQSSNVKSNPKPK